MKVGEKQISLIDCAALFGVSFTLLEAFYYQLVLGELPCAFCNLIRVGFMIFGAGLLLNLRFGADAWNYVISAIGALIGSLISLLFMFAKAPSYTTPTGSAVLGLHMYSWTFIIFTGAWIYCVVLLALLGRTSEEKMPTLAPSRIRNAVMGLFIVLIGANLVSAFLENGFDTFKAGGQKHYQMLYDGDVMKP
jgi:disulfide bond formation protein DsbB